MSYAKTIQEFLKCKVGTILPRKRPPSIGVGMWVLVPTEVQMVRSSEWFWFNLYTRHLEYKVACQKTDTPTNGQCSGEIWRCWRSDNFPEGSFATFEELCISIGLNQKI